MKLEYFLNRSNYLDNEIRNFKAELKYLLDKTSPKNNSQKVSERKEQILNQIRNLFKEKRDLHNQAYEEKLFCVDVNELSKTFQRLSNDILNFGSMSIKTYAYSKKVAVEKALKENAKVTLIIFSSEGNIKSQLIKMNFNDLSCPTRGLEECFDFSNGIFHILYPYSLLQLNSKKLDGLNINLNPSCLKDEFFSRMVYECVKNKEKSQKIQENSQKNKEKQ